MPEHSPPPDDSQSLPSLPPRESEGFSDRPLPAPVYGTPYLDEPPLTVGLVLDRPHPTNFWWSLLWCLGYLMVTQMPAAMVFLVVYIAIAPDAFMNLQNQKALARTPEYAQALAPSILVAQILGIIGSLIALRVVVGKNWTRKVALRLPSWPHALLALLGFPGIYLLAAGVDMAAKEISRALFGADSLFDLDDVIKLFGQWPIYFALLAVAFGPGFAEELFCRAFLGRGLVGNYGVITGVVLTSFLFGLLHIEPRQVAYAFLIGLMLHGAYLATRSLWIPIMLHVVNNGLSVALLHVPEVADSSEEVPPVLFLGAAVLVIAVGWALYDSRARLVAQSPDAFPWQPDFPGVEHPPPGSGTIVYRPMPSALNWVAALGGLLFLAATIALASL